MTDNFDHRKYYQQTGQKTEKDKNKRHHRSSWGDGSVKRRDFFIKPSYDENMAINALIYQPNNPRIDSSNQKRELEKANQLTDYLTGIKDFLSFPGTKDHSMFVSLRTRLESLLQDYKTSPDTALLDGFAPSIPQFIREDLDRENSRFVEMRNQVRQRPTPMGQKEKNSLISMEMRINASYGTTNNCIEKISNL